LKVELLIATRNRGKLKEIQQLLKGRDIVVKGLEAYDGLPEVVEDGDTFEANARKKAATMARLTGRMALADDSGLKVRALGGKPGIFSARYAGEKATDADNNRKLLNDMEDVPVGQRQAAFHCVMALCSPSGDCRLFEGRLDGEILLQPRGEGGFGYDPLFMVPSYGCALAELPLDVKNRISHRGLALKKLIDHLLASH
jgi:XTP/dITP diphosphohydrolase